MAKYKHYSSDEFISGEMIFQAAIVDQSIIDFAASRIDHVVASTADYTNIEFCFIENYDAPHIIFLSKNSFRIQIGIHYLTDLYTSSRIFVSHQSFRRLLIIESGECLFFDEPAHNEVGLKQLLSYKDTNNIAALPLFFCCCDLFTLHEIAHAIFGHLIFLRYPQDGSYLLADNDRSLTRQSMEYDADCFSAHKLIEHLLEFQDYAWLQGMAPAALHRCMLAEISFFICFLMYNPFSRISVSGGSTDFHPPEIFRHHTVASIAIDKAVKHGIPEEYAASILSYVFPAFINVREMINQEFYGNKNYGFDSSENQFGTKHVESLMAYSNALESRWKLLHPFLSAVAPARHLLVPPVVVD